MRLLPMLDHKCYFRYIVVLMTMYSHHLDHRNEVPSDLACVLPQVETTFVSFGRRVLLAIVRNPLTV